MHVISIGCGGGGRPKTFRKFPHINKYKCIYVFGRGRESRMCVATCKRTYLHKSFIITLHREA